MMKTGVIKHGADLGGQLGFSCADLQVSPVRVGYSSCPGHTGVRLDLHQATHDGFCWLKIACVGEVPVVVAEPEPEDTPQQSTGMVGFIGHWDLLVRRLSLLLEVVSWLDLGFLQLLGSLPKLLQQSCMGLLVRYCQWLNFIRR